MSRVARAAVRLKSDIESVFPKAKVTVLDEVDGLNVHRSILVDAKTAESLTAQVVTLADDGRIASAEVGEDGLTVTVVAGPRADYRDGFPLRAALEVVAATASPDPEPPSAPSRPRKTATRSRSAAPAGQRKSPRKDRTD